jgi:hypothetical protein
MTGILRSDVVRLLAIGLSLAAVAQGRLQETPSEEPSENAELVEPGRPAADSGLAEVPENFWPAYFAKRPQSFLVDPQNLLSPPDKRERLDFLNYHAGDSSIDLYVYVFGGDQRIPEKVRQEELTERLYSEGKPAAVVFYFMGAPDRSVLHLSPALAQGVPVAEQRRALESPVMQALAKPDPAGQFGAFLVQMSIRIYWIERMLGTGEEVVETSLNPARTPLPAEKKPGLMDLAKPHLEKAEGYAMPVGAISGVLLVVFTLRLWLKRRARYHFPDFEVEPRLGGAHAAGVGGVISFASATVPPASQRDQLPEYLRRV